MMTVAVLLWAAAIALLASALRLASRNQLDYRADAYAIASLVAMNLGILAACAGGGD